MCMSKSYAAHTQTATYHMPVPTIYDGLRKERREHHVDHMSLMKLNPAYTYMVICLFLQITMGLGKKEVHITLIKCL
jgi:hypothetical protein